MGLIAVGSGILLFFFAIAFGFYILDCLFSERIFNSIKNKKKH